MKVSNRCRLVNSLGGRGVFVAVTATIALLTAGCSAASPARTQAGRCEDGSQLVAELTDGLIRHETLLNIMAVKSNDFDSTYFVSADLEGPGLEGSDDIATWVTASLDGGSPIYSVNPLARDHSIWAVSNSMQDDGAQESVDCARGDPG